MAVADGAIGGIPGPRAPGRTSLNVGQLRCGAITGDHLTVTVELARHLVRSGVLSPDEVEAALLQALTTGVAFAKALIDRLPGAAQLVDRELARLGVPSVPVVRLAPELARNLPRGMCARLLAVPIGREPETGCVEIAAVDPLDPHIAEEFGFHLETPVSVYRAPLHEVEASLELIGSGP